MTIPATIQCLQTVPKAAWNLHFVVMLLCLSSLWAVANFYIQQSAFVAPPITKHPRLFQIGRLTLNFCAATALVLVCSRACLVLLLAADFVLSWVILAHNRYFRRAFSVCYGVKSLREGFQVSPFALQVVPAGQWVWLVSVLTAGVLLALGAEPKPRQLCWEVTGGCVAMIVLLLVAIQRSSFDFPSIRSTRVTRAVYAYGYLISWIAEFCYAPDTREIGLELIELQKVSPDRLTPLEGSWEFGGHVVVMQVESWDWNSLNARVHGEEVTPWLNRLAQSSRVFKIQAFHSQASPDMDYAVLSGGTPSPRIVSYLVPDVAYPNALPRFMQEHGLHTVAWHGTSGEFFNRRENYERMGFDELRFQEEFRGEGVARSYWGIHDEDILGASGERLRSAAGPEFHFIITLDSHVPFDLIRDSQKELFPHSQVWQENYFNSLRVLDQNLESYIGSLPKGTLVILYGDHTCGVTYGDFSPARKGQVEYVPCMVHACGAPASALGKAPNPASLPHDLRVLDVMNCLRRQVAQSRPRVAGRKSEERKAQSERRPKSGNRKATQVIQSLLSQDQDKLGYRSAD